MAYWFDNLTEDELVVTALLLGVEFMSPNDAVTNCYGYGPYWRFSLPTQAALDYQFRGGWSAGYLSRHACAYSALELLEKRDRR